MLELAEPNVVAVGASNGHLYQVLRNGPGYSLVSYDLPAPETFKTLDQLRLELMGLSSED